MISASEEQLSLLCDLTYTEVPYWYGASRRPLRLDIVCPRVRQPRPVILWLCGGAFQQMDHHLWMPDLMWYASRGFTVASAEYRVGATGHWPAPVEDAWAAVQYLRKNALELGVDAARIAVMGESAGAYIASCLGLGIGRQADCAPVQAVVDFYGVADIRAMAAYEEELGNPAVRAFMSGTEAEQPDLYAQGDLLTHTGADCAPFLIIHGQSDKRVPFAQSERFCLRLMESGADARLLPVPDAVHGDPRLYRQDIKEKVYDFLTQKLGGGKA